LIADEPTSALDVTTQREILFLLKRLAKELDFSVLFVTHDFGVVAQLCDSVTVMYAGQTVESGSMRTVLTAPQHPYTRALIACHPDNERNFEGIPGTVPSPLDPPQGCRFHPRCGSAQSVCREAMPAETADEDGHAVNCILFEGDPQARAGSAGDA
jgi:oligopeptide/dipeptide ABC transporter ATP-binding protein